MTDHPLFRRFAAALCSSMLVAACGHSDDHSNSNLSANALPSFVISGSVASATYDGNSDDLLTGGLGKTGLASATPPGFSNEAVPRPPSCAASRSGRTTGSNYRALVDMTANGGYGRFWGRMST